MDKCIDIWDYNLNMNNFNQGQQNNCQKVNGANQMSSFEKSVSNNNKQSVEKHLSHMKLNQSQLNQAIFISIENFKIDEHTEQCLFLLLRHKANPNCQINSQTPLILACKKGQLSLVKLLLEYGAKPDLLNKKNQHPLEIILLDRRENSDIAQLIINALPSVNIEFKGEPPLIMAVQKEFFKIFKMLIEKGANLIFEGENILHIIMKKKFKNSEKKKKFIKQLANRCQLMTEDAQNKTPLDYAETEDLKVFCSDLFKSKTTASKTVDTMSSSHQKQTKNKETSFQLSNTKEKQNKKKPKEEDISFSQADDEEDQEEKTEQVVDKKIIEIIEEQEEKYEQQKQVHKKGKSILNNSSFLSNNSFTAPKKVKPSGKNSTDIISPARKKNDQKKKYMPFFPLNSSSGTKKKFVKEKDEIKQTVKRGFQQQEVEEQEKSLSKKSHKIQLKKPSTVTVINPFEKIEKEQEKTRKQILKKYEEVQKLEKQLESSSSQSQEEVDLNRNIKQLVQKIDKENERKNNMINDILQLLSKKIKKQLQRQSDGKNANVNIYIYGSQSTNLCIGSSDVDLLVVTGKECSFMMNLLENSQTLTKNCEEISQVKFIRGASMPVIKIQMNQIFLHMKVDLTFQTRNHGGLQCTVLIKSFLEAEPLLRPLVLTLKSLIYANGFSDPYTGGIGSYALTLLTIALLQFTEIEKSEENLGKLLLQFFYFYGEQLDYIGQAVIIHPPGFVQGPVYTIYNFPFTTDLKPKLIVYDPSNPVNNVGRTAYRIASIKKLFSICFCRLKLQGCRLEDLEDLSFQQILNEYF